MPGHKGMGCDAQRYDLTEVAGADSLYDADGIIKESEENAGKLFGANTFYSTEGSSHAIRAMLFLLTSYAKAQGKKPLILAGRNAHKTFVGAAALLDAQIEWMIPEGASYLSCPISARDISARLEAEEKPVAVYLTSPDYLGNIADIKKISEVCHAHDVLLIVDNAHGAYLKFLPTSLHPIDLGADMCSDSAHKTLPVLTGGAYLHVSHSAPRSFCENAKNALALFGSTSPSYLVMASLDDANAYIADGYKEKLAAFVDKLAAVKARLTEGGYKILDGEPMKLSISAKAYGYKGREIENYLLANNFTPEFSDPDFVVLMPTPEISDGEMDRLTNVLLALPKKDEIAAAPPRIAVPKRKTSPREAILSACEIIPVEEALGRVLASVTVGCPPAVPILVSGEVIDEAAIECFKYYGIKTCSVMK